MATDTLFSCMRFIAEFLTKWNDTITGFTFPQLRSTPIVFVAML